MVSISSRMRVAYSRRFDKKNTSLVPRATITAVGRRPPDTSFLYVLVPEYVVETMPPMRRDHQPSTTTVSNCLVAASRDCVLEK